MEVDAHLPGAALNDGLRRQDMLHLAGADAPGIGADAARCRGVAVAAHQRRAGQRDAELRCDDVDDALPGMVDVDELDAMGGAADLRVPLAVNLATGPTWADAKS